jgi:hypothetical protein
MNDLRSMNSPAFLARVAAMFQPAGWVRMDAFTASLDGCTIKPSRDEVLAALGCDEATFAAFLAVLETRSPATAEAARDAIGLPSGPAAILHTDPDTGNVEIAFTHWPETGRTLH